MPQKTGGHDTYTTSNFEPNGNTYQEDKIKFAYIEDTMNYDKDVNNYNFAKVEDYLAPLFTQNGDGQGGVQTASNIKMQLLNLIYPVGSIYTSVKNVSPAIFLGGTWQSLDGYMLRAATSDVSDSKYTKEDGGIDGGQASIILKTNQLPAHNHQAYSGGQFVFCKPGEGGVRDAKGPTQFPAEASWHYVWSYGTGFYGATTTGNTGSGNLINIMPPYKNVYMWLRTA